MNSIHPEEYTDSRGAVKKVYRPTPRIVKMLGVKQSNLDDYRASRDEYIADGTMEQEASSIKLGGAKEQPSSMTYAESRAMLPGTNEYEHDVMRMRLGLDRGQPRSHDEVATHFNLTTERVKEIENEGLAKVRQHYADNPDQIPSKVRR
jgi:DNA-directed RNA polymerase sigma subunit (sigma70/sigma32)